MEALLAIDVGGTHQRFATIDFKGRILEKIIYPSHRNISLDQFFQILKEKILDYLKNKPCRGVALALPVVVDEKTGIIHDAPNLSFLNGAHIGEALSFLSIPWVLENDANCALLGEAWMGQGKGDSSFCCLTLGTGIGSGLFLNRKLWKGVRGMASEMGHLKIDFSGKIPCPCGDHGCLEAFASATALQKKTGHSAHELYQMASKRDPIALNAFKEMGECLGRGIGSVANLLNIELFILAGRLSQAFQFFYPSCYRVAQESAMKGPRQRLRIVQSKLGDDAGLLGAAYCWLQKYAR